MAAKKKPARVRFSVGLSYQYWPVYDSKASVVALCPNMSEAQGVADALNKSTTRKKR